MNTPTTSTTPTVESVMEMMGEMNYIQGMEVVLNLLEVLRNHHTTVGVEMIEDGEKKRGFLWMRDGVEINTCINILKKIEME